MRQTGEGGETDYLEDSKEQASSFNTSLASANISTKQKSPELDITNQLNTGSKLDLCLGKDR